MKRNIPFLVMILALAGFFYVRGRTDTATVPPIFADGLTFAQATERSAESSRVVLAMATADWCGPCQALKKGALRDPRVEQWVRDHALAVYLDVDANKEQAATLRVTSLPTLVMFRGGREVGRFSGLVGADDLLAWFELTGHATGDPASGGV